MGDSALATKDSAWGATPLVWAEHNLSEGQGDQRGKQYTEIAAYLRAHDRPLARNE